MLRITFWLICLAPIRVSKILKSQISLVKYSGGQRSEGGSAPF